MGDRFPWADQGHVQATVESAVFELFDLADVPNVRRILESAAQNELRLTAPPKPPFEEKLLFALVGNRNLQGFWRQALGQGFFDRLLGHVPDTWVMDPVPCARTRPSRI